MRVTKSEIDEQTKEVLDTLIGGRLKNSEDITLTKDFVYDVYSLFDAESAKKRKEFKNYWDLFMDIKSLYVSLKVQGLSKTISFYNNIKDFFYGFMGTRLFRKLDELDSLEATKLFLDLFKKKDEDPTPDLEDVQDQVSQGMSGDGEESDSPQNGEEGEGQPDGQDGDSQDGSESNGDGGDPNETRGGDRKPDDETQDGNDQNGLSADINNLPIDMNKFSGGINRIEDLIESGVFDDEMIKDLIAQQAGTDIKEIKLSNTMDLLDKIADRMYGNELDIYRVARKHEFIDVYKKSMFVDDSPVPDDQMDISTNKSINDVIRALPQEYLYDDDLFAKKLLENSLNITQYKSETLKKQVLYMLIDVSGSMQGQPQTYASGIAISLIKQALREKATYFMRYFDYAPSDLTRIEDTKTAKKVIKQLMRRPFSGGGTNFNAALTTAIKDIRKDPKGFEEADIMMITDGQDYIDIQDIQKKLKEINLHTVVIGSHSAALKAVSDSYTNLSLKDIRNFIN